MLVTTLSAQNSSHSYALVSGFISYKEQYPSSMPFFHFAYNDATAIGISFYYSENWGITKNLEYCLKPGVTIGGIPNFTYIKLGNCLRYWNNQNSNISVENFIEFHPISAPRFTFIYGLSFGLRLRDSLFIVPSFHKPVDSDYGLQSKTRYLVNWHFGLGFEWNY